MKTAICANARSSLVVKYFEKSWKLLALKIAAAKDNATSGLI
jgi:hypothetical protein